MRKKCAKCNTIFNCESGPKHLNITCKGKCTCITCDIKENPSWVKEYITGSHNTHCYSQQMTIKEAEFRLKIAQL